MLTVINVTDPTYAGGAVGDYDDSTNTGTDNTAAFNAAFAAAASAAAKGYAAVYVPRGAYAIKGALNTVDGFVGGVSTYGGVNFYGDGEGSRIVFPSQGSGQIGFVFQNMNKIVVEKLQFTGRDIGGVTEDCASCLSFANSRSVTVRDCDFKELLVDICVVSYYNCGSVTQDCRFAGIFKGANFTGTVSHTGSTLWATVEHCRMHYDPAPYTNTKGSGGADPWIFFGENFDADEHLVRDCDIECYGSAILVDPGTTASKRLWTFRVHDSAANITTTTGCALRIKNQGAVYVEVDGLFVRGENCPSQMLDVAGVDRLDVRNLQRVLDDASWNRTLITLDSSVKEALFQQVQYEDLIADVTATRILVDNDHVEARLRTFDAPCPANVLVKPSSTDEHAAQLGTADPTSLAIGVALDAAAYATGSVTFVGQASIIDQSTWDVTDGNGLTKTFCFYTSSNLPGCVGVPIASGWTATQVASAFLTALAGSGLSLSGSLHAVGSAQVDFTAGVFGEEGNVLWIAPTGTSWAAYGYMTGGKKRVRVAERSGQEVSGKSDGATALVPGDAVTSSGTSAGRVKKTTAGGTKIVGRVMSTAAASADAVVNVIWHKETL